jgi:hypothetical protein|tara:strand:- start:354 stop:554 length:201 start_codon:yes stop_codon:yes gene_type:complete
MNRTKILEAIDTVDHRLETASKDFHDSTRWNEEDYLGGDSFVGTYQDWIDAALDDIRDLVLAEDEL